MKSKVQNDQDVLLNQEKDRRMLSYIPDPTGERSVFDRRGRKESKGPEDLRLLAQQRKLGIRYRGSFPVRIEKHGQKDAHTLEGTSTDISDTGILVRFNNKQIYEQVCKLENVKLSFRVPDGMMPEGHENRYKITGKVVRSLREQKEVAFEFDEDLMAYMRRRKDRYLLVMSSVCLAFISLCIILMRAESVIYFKYNSVLYSYSIIAAMFLLTRYLFGALYKPVPIDPKYTPSVTVIIPCFNEEEWIQKTILSCFDQSYPADKLKVIVVDDCSTDHSVDRIRELVNDLTESEDSRYHVRERLKYFVQE